MRPAIVLTALASWAALPGCSDAACRTDADCRPPSICVHLAVTGASAPASGRCERPCLSDADCWLRGRPSASCHPLQGEGSTTHTMAAHGNRYNTTPTAAGVIKVCIAGGSAPAR